MKQNIESGIFLNNKNQVQVNTNRDVLYRDVVLLNQDTSGKFTDEGVMIIYGFQYNPECRDTDMSRFREALKHPQVEDRLDEFVEAGVLHINKYVDLESFGAMVRIAPTRRPSILDIMYLKLADYCKKSISFDLIKETYDHVAFDTAKALQALIDIGHDEDYAQTLVDSTLALFNELKSKGYLFEMKRFSPRIIRSSFSNFLKFANDKEKKTYELLQGIDVLIYDDLLTSGQTIKETARYLRSINPSNTLTAFVLIKQ